MSKIYLEKNYFKILTLLNYQGEEAEFLFFKTLLKKFLQINKYKEH